MWRYHYVEIISLVIFTKANYMGVHHDMELGWLLVASITLESLNGWYRYMGSTPKQEIAVTIFSTNNIKYNFYEAWEASKIDCVVIWRLYKKFIRFVIQSQTVCNNNKNNSAKLEPSWCNITYYSVISTDGYDKIDLEFYGDHEYILDRVFDEYFEVLHKEWQTVYTPNIWWWG